LSVQSRFIQGTIGEAIERQSERQANHPAIVASGFRPITYHALQCIIGDVRDSLRAAGFGPTARIAIALPDGPIGALAIIATACSTIALPLNPKHTLNEITAFFSVLRPDAVVLLQGSDSPLRRVAACRGITAIDVASASEGKLGLRISITRGRTAEPHAQSHPDSPAFILQTSGTTSGPKLVPFSHRNMLAAATRLQEWFNLTPQDCCLCVNPIYYSHGLTVTIFTPLLAGGTVAFPADPRKFEYSEWFGTLEPTWYSASPPIHRLVYDQTQSRTGLKQKLRFILSGGAPLAASVREGLEKTLGVPVIESYGSSEAALMASNLPWPGRARPGTVGTFSPNTVKIIDEDGHALRPRQRGEIVVQGPTVMSGYCQAPELNRASFVDGWFKTGDIGSIDEDGFLTLHGRQKDLINRGGEKISPGEIDEILKRHPAVAEAAAFAIPHSRLGEDVAAAIVLNPGMTASQIELRTFVSDRLAAFKVPRRIFVVEDLPKGLSGKVLRQNLGNRFSVVTTVAHPPAAPSGSDLSSKLVQIWQRLLNRAPIGIDDEFFEIGGDSLLAVELLIEIEPLVGRPVPSSILFEASTIRQLTQLLSQDDGLKNKPLFQLSSGSGTPLFFFHGAFNTGGGYVTRLARLLGPSQSLFVVTPHGLDDASIPSSLEAMAADRVSLIRNVQPRGPYRLAGYCLSGLVAFETARLLINFGEKVDFVGMIDPPTINARRSVRQLLAAMARARPLMGPAIDREMMQTWYALAAADKSRTLPLQLWRSWRSLALLWWRWIKGGRVPLHVCSTEFSKDDAYAIATSRYAPSSLAVPVLYFSAEHTGMAWRRISPDIKTIELAGDHAAIVTDPTEVARHLRTVLDA
jgi:oxalate---CoA ligase